MSDLPLFYRSPVPLSARLHGPWRLKSGDLDFAAQCTAVPLVIDEFAPASRCYPLLFSAQDGAPLALLGLERRNLFVSDGEWAKDHYVPAYVRRYPFVFVRTSEPDGFALAVDADSGRIAQAGEEGVALFDGDEPSALTRQALDFCSRFTGEYQATQSFSAQLKSHDLLAGRDASVTLADGRRLGVTGFDVVDAQKFAALPEATIVEWHRNGWLALVHFHLASLARFGELLSRQSAMANSATEHASH